MLFRSIDSLSLSNLAVSPVVTEASAVILARSGGANGKSLLERWRLNAQARFENDVSLETLSVAKQLSLHNGLLAISLDGSIELRNASAPALKRVGGAPMTCNFWRDPSKDWGSLTAGLWIAQGYAGIRLIPLQ